MQWLYSGMWIRLWEVGELNEIAFCRNTTEKSAVTSDSVEYHTAGYRRGAQKPEAPRISLRRIT